MSDLTLLYELIKRFEGCKLTPYICPAGVWTCGWGSTGPDVFPGRKWTQAYADQRLVSDVQYFMNGVSALCPGLSGEPLLAITDFAYNLGLGRLKASTLRRRINEKNYPAAAIELRKWVNGGGKKLPGLVLRREAECKLLLSL